MVSGNLGNKEKKLIALIVVVFLLTFVAPEFVNNYSVQYLREKGGLKSNLQGQISELQTNIDSIEDRKIILDRYVKRYESLVERGLVFLPDEVEVVKEMKRIRERGKYQGIDFSFSDKIVLPSDDTVYTKESSIMVNVAPLVLEMGMLHDMDMFMFMESLSEKIPNLAFPVKCSMTLTKDDFVVVDRENMRGECQINWYSVDDPESNIGRNAAEETVLADG